MEPFSLRETTKPLGAPKRKKPAMPFGMAGWISGHEGWAAGL